jgi:hypothetical protein
MLGGWSRHVQIGPLMLELLFGFADGLIMTLFGQSTTIKWQA